MIDRARLNELRNEIGAEDLSEVAAIFLDETDEAMALLLQLPPDALSAQLHFLKGSALNMGLRLFAELCHQAEAQATTLDLGRLSAAYAASKAVFLQAVAQDAAA